MLAKNIKSQNAIEGTARNSIARLHPKRDVMNPNVKIPPSAPKLFTEPNQEICSFVSGPFKSGVWSDIKIGIDGVNQPITQPQSEKIKHLCTFSTNKIQLKFKLPWPSIIKVAKITEFFIRSNFNRMVNKWENIHLKWLQNIDAQHFETQSRFLPCLQRVMIASKCCCKSKTPIRI